ncbi:hypothetical protein DQ04_26371000, partial [Trypanosoma grayi]|uniref:hypothetical protein n=1 Tax=Trypanosoma grayi TaxID=71804 RepID=UPI0004F48BD7
LMLLRSAYIYASPRRSLCFPSTFAANFIRASHSPLRLSTLHTNNPLNVCCTTPRGTSGGQRVSVACVTRQKHMPWQGLRRPRHHTVACRVIRIVIVLLGKSSSPQQEIDAPPSSLLLNPDSSIVTVTHHK